QPSDLVVQNLDVPENAQPGDTVTVEYEIFNQGGKSAELFAAGFYLFDDEYLANNDSLDYQDVPEVFFSQGSAASSVLSLEPGEGTGIISEEITIPETWEGYSPDANYYLGVEADVFDDIDEGDEANNSLRELGEDYSAIKITQADLVVQNLDVPENAQPGDTVIVEYEIYNQGGQSADLFAAGFYLFDDEYLANNDSLDYQDVPEVFFSQGSAASSVLSLEPGEGTGIISEEITIPETWEGYSPDANYYLGVEADVFDDIDEGDEANNSLRELGKDYSAIEITEADLQTVSFDVDPETIKTGEDFTVEYEITNAGTEAADLFGAGFFIFDEDYLNNHDALDIADAPMVYPLVGDVKDAIISLEPGESTGVVSTELTMPENWEGFAAGSGNYYIGFAADVYDDISESNEMNNSLVGSGIDYLAVMIDVGATEL
ncbi:MAG: CARDB domain-containing protein, partial [Cyanobacteria bacterium P01_G01_bin.19]